MIPLVWVPNVETFLLAGCLVFGVVGLLVMVVGALQIIREEHALKRAREADSGVQFDPAFYPGRTIQ